jgi:hypothetical protein
MTDGAVTMSEQMNESDSPVGGVPSADPLLSESGNGGSAGFVPEPDDAGPVPEPDVEIVDGFPVLAEVRTVERAAPAALPAVQVAAVAATGFVAGAATVALVKRRAARKVARNGRAAPRRAADLLPIAASRSFLVDVHVLAKPE